MPFFTRLLSSQMTTLPPLPKTNLTGQTYIVTGANCGIGLEIARHLADHNAARLILAVRNVQSCEAVKETLLRPGLEVEVWRLDMASYRSMAQFIKRCESLKHLDGVALNAGMLGGGDRAVTEDGHEIVTQVNVISPVVLAMLLAPLLEATTTGHASSKQIRPRIIFTGSSVAEAASTKNLDPTSPLAGLDDKSRYVAGNRYYESKLVLHAAVRQLIPRLPDTILTNVNPGFCQTPLYRNGGPAGFMAKRIGRSAEQGARNVSWAVLSLDKSTDYYHDCRPSKLHAPWLESTKGKSFSESLYQEISAEKEKVRKMI